MPLPGAKSEDGEIILKKSAQTKAAGKFRRPSQRIAYYVLNSSLHDKFRRCIQVTAETSKLFAVR
jgi:hypothetical protein